MLDTLTFFFQSVRSTIVFLTCSVVRSQRYVYGISVWLSFTFCQINNLGINGSESSMRILEQPENWTIANLDCNILYVKCKFLLQVTGREMLIHLIDRLLSSYHTNGTIKSLLDTTRIHIMVSMNPDGYENSTQYIRRYNHRRCVGTYGRYLFLVVKHRIYKRQ